MNKREAKEYVREYGNLIGVLVKQPYTWVSICIVFKGEPLACTGIASCGATSMGFAIAQGRAVAGLADKIVVRTWQEKVAMNGKGGLVLTVAGHNAITAQRLSCRGCEI